MMSIFGSKAQSPANANPYRDGAGNWWWKDEKGTAHGPLPREREALDALLRHVSARGAQIAGIYALPNPPRDIEFVNFLKQYVLERAATFEKGREKEDAWATMNDAEVIYKAIHRKEELKRQEEYQKFKQAAMQQGGVVSQAPQNPQQITPGLVWNKA